MRPNATSEFQTIRVSYRHGSTAGGAKEEVGYVSSRVFITLLDR